MHTAGIYRWYVYPVRDSDDIVQIVIAANAMGRIAAIATRNETPAAQWRTLSILGSEGPQRLGELARLSRVTQPGMTRLVTTMTEAGLVMRTEDPSDSRATVVSTTPAGAAALAAWHVQLREMLAPFFADLSDEDWLVLTRASEILTSRIDTVQEGTR